MEGGSRTLVLYCPSKRSVGLSSAIPVLALILLVIAAAPTRASAATPNVFIGTQNVFGGALSGFYVSVSQGGQTVKSGFSPTSFHLAPGTYVVGVSDYAGYFFDRWSGGSAGRFETVTVTPTGNLSLTALFSTTQANGPDFAIAASQVSFPVQAGTQQTTTLEVASIGGFTSPVLFNMTSSVIPGVTVRFGPVVVWPTADSITTSVLTVSVSEYAALGTYSLTITGASVSTEHSTTLAFTIQRPAPYNGIVVYAHRSPSAFWAPCFATSCDMGTGPDAAMWFVLYSSNGTVLQTGLSNENGYAFSNLNPNLLYYVEATDCDTCHNSTHDVVFNHWEDGNTSPLIMVAPGCSFDAWYNFVPLGNATYSV